MTNLAMENKKESCYTCRYYKINSIKAIDRVERLIAECTKKSDLRYKKELCEEYQPREED